MNLAIYVVHIVTAAVLLRVKDKGARDVRPEVLLAWDQNGSAEGMRSDH